MSLCDGREDQRTAGSAASSCSKISFDLRPRPARDDKQIGRVEFPTAIYLLMKQNQQLIDFSFNLEPSVTKLVCVRTSSKDFPPSF